MDIELNNTYARQFFFQNYKKDHTNVVINRIEEARDNNLLTQDAFRADINKLKEDLESDPLNFSNDYTCSSIMDIVSSLTTNKKLKDVITKIYIGFTEEHGESPHIKKKFFDSSSLIILDERTYRYLESFSELTAIHNIYNYESCEGFNTFKYISLINKCIQKQNNYYSKDHLEEFEKILFEQGIEFVDKFCLWSSILHEVTLCYLIGHEIGHFYLEHNGYKEDKEVNHQMEHDADEFAVLFTRTYLKSYSYETDQQGSLYQKESYYVCAIALPMIYMAALSPKSLYSNTLSHPSIRDRYISCLFSIYRIFGEDSAKQTSNIVSWYCNNFIENKSGSEWWKLNENAFERFAEVLPGINETLRPI